MFQNIGLVLFSEVLWLGLCSTVAGNGLRVDDRPATPGEWGFRPADESMARVNPPGFVWRPQEDAVGYILQVSRRQDFSRVDYERRDLDLFSHCPPHVFEHGDWYWRFAYITADGQQSPWSEVRHFVISPEATAFPMPEREVLFSRIPREHPRLFVRPEEFPRLCELAQGELKPIYDVLVEECEKIIADPPPTDEPPKYPEGIERGGDPWRDLGKKRYHFLLAT